MKRALKALRREDDGFAMIVAVILLAVIGTLVALTLSVGAHSDFASGRGRNHIESLHVAESGVEEAVRRLQDTNGGFSGSFSGTINQGTNEGSYDVTVTKLPRQRYQIDVTGTVGSVDGLRTTRRLRVFMAPPPSFKYALFSYTSVSTKNNDTIAGDIWANQNVTVELGDIVEGSVWAATGYVTLKNGSLVKGDVWTGGFDPNKDDVDPSKNNAIYLEANALIEGYGKASVTAPTDPVTCGGEDQGHYHVRLDGGAHIGGNVTTWGAKSGAGTVGPPGTVSANVCTAAPAAKSLPEFTFSDLNYDPATLHQYGSPSTSSATAISEFQAYISAAGGRISGTFYINQTPPVNQDVRVDLTGVVLTGDTTIITNTPVFSNGVTDDTSDAVFTLASTYQPPSGAVCDLNQDKSDCTFHLKNNFSPTCETAVLIYSPYGPVAIKNNQLQCGAIYADDILIKNNQSLEYDSRVERVVGFGPETYVIQQWLELNP